MATARHRKHFGSLVFAGVCLAAAGAGAQDGPVTASLTNQLRSAVERAIANGDARLAEEADRVPGLTYGDISRVSRLIPGTVQIPDPMAPDPSSRAISVPGGLVTEECRHFVRGALADRLMQKNGSLSHEKAMARISGHMRKQRKEYSKIAGASGLLRSDVAAHDADCPICGPLNAAEIECHKSVVKQSPVRELVMFEFASDRLRPEYLGMIAFIRSRLESDAALKVALIGRASIPGGPVPNFTLSAKRITSVWRGLVEAGIPAERIVAIPIGEDEPHIDLQLAIEYGLEGDFATYGQKPLNQSVYMAVYRADTATMTVDVSAPADEELNAHDHQGHAHGSASAALRTGNTGGTAASAPTAAQDESAQDARPRATTVTGILEFKMFANYVKTKMGMQDASEEEILQLYTQYQAWQIADQQ